MNVNDIKIMQFDNEAQFSIWKSSNPNVEILNINFIPNLQNGAFTQAPKVESFIATEGQTTFTFSSDFSYLPGTNQLKVFLNGMYLLSGQDYLEADSKTIIMKEPLYEGDIVAVLSDNNYFSQTNNEEILNAYKILIAYRELSSQSIAQVRNINIKFDRFGIYLSWEDIFGTELEKTLGPNWRELEGFRNNIEYMSFMDWKGVKVVRKVGSPPVSIYDGEVIVETTVPNKYLITPYLDKAENLQFNTTYYYGVFPCDGWGVYNTSIYNVVSVTFVETKWTDIVKNFYLSVSKTASQTLSVKWNDPNVSDWGGTKIVLNQDREPVDENDGIVVIDNKERNKYSIVGFSIEGLTNDQTYYIKAFAYDINGVVQMSTPAVLEYPIEVLDNIVIDFGDDSWKDYFADIGVGEVVDAPEAENGKCFMIKPAYINIDKFGNVQETVFTARLKPVEYNRNGAIMIRFKTRSNAYGKFEILVQDDTVTEFRDSGYYLDFNFKRFIVNTGRPELIFKLACYDMNAQVLIDKIVFER